MARHSFPLRTERLLLRPFTDADLDWFHDLMSRKAVTRYLPWGPLTREESRARLDRIKTLTSFDAEGRGIRLAAILPEAGIIVGDVSLWERSREHRVGEIGFVIHPDHQGHGYATEAAAALIEVGFRQVGLHRIEGHAVARNSASTSVMERLGMRFEAQLRQNEFIKGEWSDEVIYAILASEWEERG